MPHWIDVYELKQLIRETNRVINDLTEEVDHKTNLLHATLAKANRLRWILETVEQLDHPQALPGDHPGAV